MPKGSRNTIQGILGRLIPQPNGCLIWPGKVGSTGHALVNYEGKLHSTYRLLYEHLVGAVPDGMVLDHFFCGNGRCCNVAHLEPVTQRENLVRGHGFAGTNARKTHCPQGHPYDGDNLYIASGRYHRRCRLCVRALNRRAKAKRQEKIRDAAESV